MNGKLRTVVRWVLPVALGGAAAYAALTLYEPAAPEVPTARVERRDFITTISARGELKSARSVQIMAPQTPDLKIVRLAADGKPIKAGEVVVAFDASTQEDRLLEEVTEFRQVESEIEQAKAEHSIADEDNDMVLMKAQYELERAELEASKQEILSEIEGAKNRIDVGVAEGDLTMSQVTIEATDLQQNAELTRLHERLDKAARDRDTTRRYLGSMALRSPVEGVVNILPNNRAQGSFGTSRPPFQEGDTVWTGAVLAEIPDLSSLRVEFRVEEIDRGRVQEGQPVRIRVDAVPEARLAGKVDWLSPIATLVFRRLPPEKNFPAYASVDELHPRLQPGMSCTVDVIVERRPEVLVVPAKASFQIDGKPHVFVADGGSFRQRPIEVASRNSEDIVIASGVEEGERIALVNPRTEALRER